MVSVTTAQSTIERGGVVQTEIGLLPDDWVIKPASEFAKIITGPFGTLLKASEYSGTDGVPLISVGEIREGFLSIRADTPRVPETVVRRLPQYVLRAGDIVFGRKGGVDRSALVRHEQDGWFLGSDGICMRSTAAIHSGYLALQFASKRVQGWLLQHAIGTTMPSLNQEILRRVLIPFPPTQCEQQAIAAALSDADALIEGLENLIAKKRAIKQGAMQELLSGRRRLAGFSEEWVTRKFGAMTTIRNDKTNTLGADVAAFCIELEQIDQGTGQLLGFSDARQRASIKYRFQKGDVLFGRLRPYLRKYWSADRVGVCSTEIWPLIPKGASLVAPFLAQIIKTDAFVEAASSSYGTHMPRSDWKALADYEIAIPTDPDEQNAIAGVLSEMDEELETLTEHFAKARQIKQGMMQELLIGRVRLV